MPNSKDEKCFHCWVIVGYNFKSDIIFYKVPGNINRKMLLQVYINQILEPVIKPELFRKKNFILEEDDDSRYGKAKIATL